MRTDFYFLEDFFYFLFFNVRAERYAAADTCFSWSFIPSSDDERTCYKSFLSFAFFSLGSPRSLLTAVIGFRMENEEARLVPVQQRYIDV